MQVNLVWKIGELQLQMLVLVLVLVQLQEHFSLSCGVKLRSWS